VTPGARAEAAIELLDALGADRTRPADVLVSGWFRRRRYAGGGDRRAIQSIVYTVLRRRAQLDWWLRKSGHRPDARRRVIAALMLGEGWRASDLASAFGNGRYGPTPLTVEERSLAGALDGEAFDNPAQPLAVRGNIPDWMEDGFAAALGGALEGELSALLAEAPLDLRINSLKTTRAEVAEKLRSMGLEAVPTPFSPWGLRLAGRVNLANSAIIRDGLAEPQDESSQVAALLTGVRPGDSVVDFCAGAGGKTLALAAMMQDRGRLIACDNSRTRLSRAVPRLERAGVGNFDIRVLDAPDGLWAGADSGSFDCVLVDAPCTGTGTWRRHPESRWRIDAENLTQFLGLQRQILATASRLVAPGGRLLYAVCSLLPEEGEAQVTEFLGNDGDFTIVPVRREWSGNLDSVCPAGDAFLRLRPGRDGTDGFFVALLAREGGGALVPAQ
jgi:16S rRNA (cytosine967-C5)-methyltransferase